MVSITLDLPSGVSRIVQLTEDERIDLNRGGSPALAELSVGRNCAHTSKVSHRTLRTLPGTT